jgi:plasmid stabilization system protein ParE
MAYRVTYKKRYLNNVAKLVFYLRNEWNDTVAAEVATSINKKIAQVSRHPYIGNLQGREKIRSVIVSRHSRLYYRIERNTIMIMNIIDMRINPANNPYKE